MKKIILLLFVAIACACGSKQNTEEITTEEETQLVEEASQELNSRVNDITNQADSLNQAVDSLLNTMNN